MTQDQPGRPIQKREVALPPVDLPGILCLTEGARGLVVFARGGGSSLSPRERDCRAFYGQAAHGNRQAAD